MNGGSHTKEKKEKKDTIQKKGDFIPDFKKYYESMTEEEKARLEAEGWT